ncbi:unnamed protein product [Vitrella brassicaformis CCMP3155]|uniref:Uncharacterized protein n=1 Tax=Vitrella brassicaformis (strain CCMP3155) TaxID=1169540 RepID=A0A0G4FCZ9_VITBC|nr:unnamed protein product [Vitrella brassicaformis CCMP3155]|eukprot:CEM11108.1 unnamed protein product [Vitrella brassicaformis CCMP3155]
MDANTMMDDRTQRMFELELMRLDGHSPRNAGKVSSQEEIEMVAAPQERRQGTDIAADVMIKRAPRDAIHKRMNYVNWFFALVVVFLAVIHVLAEQVVADLPSFYDDYGFFAFPTIQSYIDQSTNTTKHYRVESSGLSVFYAILWALVATAGLYTFILHAAFFRRKISNLNRHKWKSFVRAHQRRQSIKQLHTISQRHISKRSVGGQATEGLDETRWSACLRSARIIWIEALLLLEAILGVGGRLFWTSYFVDEIFTGHLQLYRVFYIGGWDILRTHGETPPGHWAAFTSLSLIIALHSCVLLWAWLSKKRGLAILLSFVVNMTYAAHQIGTGLDWTGRTRGVTLGTLVQLRSANFLFFLAVWYPLWKEAHTLHTLDGLIMVRNYLRWKQHNARKLHPTIQPRTTCMRPLPMPALRMWQKMRTRPLSLSAMCPRR